MLYSWVICYIDYNCVIPVASTVRAFLEDLNSFWISTKVLFLVSGRTKKMYMAIQVQTAMKTRKQYCSSQTCTNKTGYNTMSPNLSKNQVYYFHFVLWNVPDNDIAFEKEDTIIWTYLCCDIPVWPSVIFEKWKIDILFI